MTPASSLFLAPAHYSAQTGHCSQAHWSVQGGSMTAPVRSCRRDKSKQGRCPECGRPTSEFAVTGNGPTFPRAGHSADGARCSDHARTDAQRHKASVKALASVAEFTLGFCGLVNS